jgi:hypothetical protein
MQKEKKGFSIELFTRESIENYTVYFESKSDKIVFCYIQDSAANRTFKAKAVKHETDNFDKTEGMKIAFDRALEKRFNYYNKRIAKIEKALITIRDQDVKIEKKFYKFINNTKK